MMLNRVLIAVLLISSGTLGCAQQQAEGQGRGKSLSLAYSGNLDGELEPCGCSVEGDLGGIMRHATTLKRLRDEHPGLVALSSGGMLASEVPQDKLTGEYILKGFARLDYDAVGVQWRDLAYGDQFIRDTKLPWVATNLLSDGFAREREIERSGVKLAVFSWLDPADDPRAAMHGGHQSVDPDPARLRAALQAARQRGEVTVLTTSMALDAAQKSLPLDLVDILFIRSAYEVFGEPQKVGDTLVLQPGSRGMRLGHIEITFNGAGRVQQWQNEVIAMPSSVPNDPALKGWYEEYNAKVKASYLKQVALRKRRETGQGPYVGADVCKQCHSAEYEKWRTTLHSGAFSKLERVGKSFDPTCIKCHTVGFGQEGGFIDIDTTPQLLNVQCENCHGAGKAHVESNGVKATPHKAWQPQQICAQCHIQTHSPSFKFDVYWPRIRHGALK